MVIVGNQNMSTIHDETMQLFEQSMTKPCNYSNIVIQSPIEYPNISFIGSIVQNTKLLLSNVQQREQVRETLNLEIYIRIDKWMFDSFKSNILQLFYFSLK